MLRGQVIAESDRIREVGRYSYFPRNSVKMDMVKKTPRVESDLVCQHGFPFYDVTVNAPTAGGPHGHTKRYGPR